MAWDYIAFCLTMIYSILFCAEVKQLVDIFWQRNRIVNYRNGIIFFMTFAALLRAIFWAKVTTPSYAPSIIFTLCYYLPVWLIFAALSLLSVFYISASANRHYGKWPWRIWIVSNAVFLGLDLTIGCLMNDVDTHGNTVYGLYMTYAIFLDALTALLVGFFGHRFVSLHAEDEAQLLLPRSIDNFRVINWILVCCFLGRSTYLALLGSGLVFSHSAAEISFNGEHKRTSWVVMVFFLLTEVLPSLCILYLLWRSTRYYHLVSEDESTFSEDYLAQLQAKYSNFDIYDSLYVGYDSASLRHSSAEDSVVRIFFSDARRTRDNPHEENEEQEEEIYNSLLGTQHSVDINYHSNPQ
eukprot:gene7355-8137_t